MNPEYTLFLFIVPNFKLTVSISSDSVKIKHT